MKLKNLHPTEAEKLMFKWDNLYLIDKTDTYLKYVAMYTECENFPTVLNIDEDAINYNYYVTFDILSETVSLPKQFFIYDFIHILDMRMKELGFTLSVSND